MAVPKSKVRGADSVLADGTSLSPLVDLDRREISLRVLNDPQIYQWVLERLWFQACIIVEHDSEIPGALPNRCRRRIRGTQLFAVAPQSRRANRLSPGLR